MQTITRITTENLEALHRHQMRVAGLSYKLALQLGLPIQVCEEILIAGQIHDNGKKYLNPAILNKPSKLTEEEMEHVKLHVFYGALDAFRRKYSSVVVKLVFHHHENYNGTGYPTSLEEDNIPIGARILRVCDCFDALRMSRPYKKELSIKQTLEIMEGEKAYYDPKIFHLLKELVANESMKRKYIEGQLVAQ